MPHSGRQISKIRKLREMTQAQLAEEVGMSRAYLARVETGLQEPSLDLLERIAKSLRVPSGILLLDPEDFPRGVAYEALARALENAIKLTGR